MKIGAAQRDVWIWGVAVIGAGLLGQWLARTIPLAGTLQAPFALACALAASVVMKVLTPNHTILRLIPWPYFVLVMPVVIGICALLSDWTLLGFLTLPTMAGLIIALGLIHVFLGPREPGDVRADRDDGEDK
jgi:hypothetical protein